ncbi:hypothetical protein pipiens_019829 [Culex pipiens pipiens]|uniref:Uncharacterized protein n=1 Tax=Culex pipiens pipiens TaxID=38569 RepID=A0ABD1DR69_CULPP
MSSQPKIRKSTSVSRSSPSDCDGVFCCLSLEAKDTLLLASTRPPAVMVIVVVVVAAAAAVFDELIPRWDRREGRNTWFPMKDGEHSGGMQTTTGGTHVRRDPERIYGGNFVHLREKTHAPKGQME